MYTLFIQFKKQPWCIFKAKEDPKFSSETCNDAHGNYISWDTKKMSMLGSSLLELVLLITLLAIR